MKLSVVTVCYNSAKTIANCVNSVCNLAINDMEYIVIDGLSVDSTVNIVKEYIPVFKSKNIPIKVISEKDNGIYDAMNKAIEIAEGDWIIYLNSDDCFAATDCLNPFFANNYDNYEVVYGNVIVQSGDMRVYQKPRELERLKSGTEMPFCHQATFTKKDVLKHYRFDEQYRIIADIDLYLRIFENGGTFFYIDEYMSVFSDEGISQTRRIESIKEGKRLLQNHNCYTFERKIVLNGYIIWYWMKKKLPASMTALIKKNARL